jgi:protein-disulfide isomerase
MTHTRRHLILGAAALALAACGESEDANKTKTGTGTDADVKVDLAKLNEEPAHGEMSIGPADAKVTIIEYASASCPHCANFFKTTYQDLKKDYIDTGKVRFVFREFPHEESAMAAFMLARCAPKEKYFPMIDMYFEQQKMWTAAPQDGLFKIAQLAGMTKEQFDACLKNEAVAKGIMAVRDKAAKDFGVDGIPTFFVNGQQLGGEKTIEDFKKIIDPLLG